MHEVAIVGGGPVGLTLAIACAQRGVSTILFERQKLPADKTCGEGVMPSGLEVLRRLGVGIRGGCAPFAGIRYVQEDGSHVEGRFKEGAAGLGIRRTALSSALTNRARELGVTLRESEGVRRHDRAHERVTLRTDHDVIEARMLVACDGLHSPLRKAEGLDGEAKPLRRYGMRRHFQVKPWTDLVEVYFAPDAEAYVTPCGTNEVGVAILWEDGRVARPTRFDSLFARFPLLRQRLGEVPSSSAVRGAGPFWHSTRSLVQDRFALLGDAAGYVDALTGEGISLGLQNALTLAEVLPNALVKNAERRTLLPYEREAKRRFAAYERLTYALLLLARRPRARRTALSLIRRVPGSFEQLLRAALR